MPFRHGRNPTRGGLQDHTMESFPYPLPNFSPDHHVRRLTSRDFTEVTSPSASYSVPLIWENENTETDRAMQLQARFAECTHGVHLETPSILGRVANRIRKLFQASDPEYRSVRDRPPTPHPTARDGEGHGERGNIRVSNRTSSRSHPVLPQEERGHSLMVPISTIEYSIATRNASVWTTTQPGDANALLPESSIPPLNLPPPIIRVPGHNQRMLRTVQANIILRQQQRVETLQTATHAHEPQADGQFRSQVFESDEETLVNTRGIAIRPGMLYGAGPPGL